MCIFRRVFMYLNLHTLERNNFQRFPTILQGRIISTAMFVFTTKYIYIYIYSLATIVSRKVRVSWTVTIFNHYYNRWRLYINEFECPLQNNVAFESIHAIDYALTITSYTQYITNYQLETIEQNNRKQLKSCQVLIVVVV